MEEGEGEGMTGENFCLSLGTSMGEKQSYYPGLPLNLIYTYSFFNVGGMKRRRLEVILCRSFLVLLRSLISFSS